MARYRRKLSDGYKYIDAVQVLEPPEDSFDGPGWKDRILNAPGGVLFSERPTWLDRAIEENRFWFDVLTGDESCSRLIFDPFKRIYSPRPAFPGEWITRSFERPELLVALDNLDNYEPVKKAEDMLPGEQLAGLILALFGAHSIYDGSTCFYSKVLGRDLHSAQQSKGGNFIGETHGYSKHRCPSCGTVFLTEKGGK